MKNTSMIIVAVLALVIGGVGAYAFMNRTDSAMTKSDSMAKTETMVKDEKAMVADATPMAKTDETGMKKDAAMMEDSSKKMMQKESKYAPFSPELLANSASTRRVLFFYANWCPTCIPSDKNFSANLSKLPADVTLIRVNYNDTDTDQAEKDLAKKYGVTYQHTFVQIDAKGNEVTKWNGGQIDELLSNIK